MRYKKVISILFECVVVVGGEATFVRQIGTKLKVYLYDCIYQTRSNFKLNVCVIYVIVEDCFK